MPSAAAERWSKARSFHHSLDPPERIARRMEREGRLAVTGTAPVERPAFSEARPG